MTDSLTRFRWLDASPGSPDDLLDDIFCVSFFHQLAPAEVLHRFGSGEPCAVPKR